MIPSRLIHCLLAAGTLTTLALAAEIDNPAILYDQFLKLANGLDATREQNRITEEQFIEMSKEPGTIILDARTKERYDNIHVKGAAHLAFTEFTTEALAKAIPDKSTRILIYKK